MNLSDNIIQLGLLFGKELGKLKREIKLCQQAILELNEELDEIKTTKAKRKVRKISHKTKAGART